MTEAKAFRPVKLVAGIIFREEPVLARASAGLERLFGPCDHRSACFPFDTTDYYEAEMGPGLKRLFLSFRHLVGPEQLPDIKLRTNALERELQAGLGAAGRPANIDPGFLTASALIMATAKDFSHRVPLRDGVYAHLELLFTKEGIRFLDWTYPDFKKKPGYGEFLLEVRQTYLAQLREARRGGQAPSG
jgi:hypothetical protein